MVYTDFLIQNLDSATSYTQPISVRKLIMLISLFFIVIYYLYLILFICFFVYYVIYWYQNYVMGLQFVSLVAIRFVLSDLFHNLCNDDGHQLLDVCFIMRLRYFLNVTLLSLYSNDCCYLTGRCRGSSFICFHWDCVDNSDNHISVILHNLLPFLFWSMECK